MPNIADASPDEAIQLGRCPECGRQLLRSAARAHAEDHWGGGRPRSPEAQRRYDLLVKFAAGTDDQPISIPTEAHPIEERHWWSLQNRLGNIWSQIAIAPIGAGLIEIGDKNYSLAGAYILSGAILMFVVNAKMKTVAPAGPPDSGSKAGRRYIAYASVLLTWVLFGSYIYGHFTEKPDSRLLPLDTPSFFDGMQTDTTQVFRMVCYPYDPNSCNIAARYRDRFANYWTPSADATFFALNNPALTPGFQIVTQSEHHPSRVLINTVRRI